jgi:hypothetical protein
MCFGAGRVVVGRWWELLRVLDALHRAVGWSTSPQTWRPVADTPLCLSFFPLPAAATPPLPFCTPTHLLFHRGVFWDKKSKRWRCQLGHKNKKIFLGYYNDPEEAARAYDVKLVELNGAAGEEGWGRVGCGWVWF